MIASLDNNVSSLVIPPYEIIVMIIKSVPDSLPRKYDKTSSTPFFVILSFQLSIYQLVVVSSIESFEHCCGSRSLKSVIGMSVNSTSREKDFTFTLYYPFDPDESILLSFS